MTAYPAMHGFLRDKRFYDTRRKQADEQPECGVEEHQPDIIEHIKHHVYIMALKAKVLQVEDSF
jgi:hypothetical protein